jgi:hypothetical protein
MIIALMFIPMSGSQSTKQYDPWLDYNDDGKISLADLVSLAQSYGTTGDPTKPVIINHNWLEGNASFNLSPNGDWSISIPTTGFRTITITIRAYSNDAHKFQVLIRFIGIVDEKLEVVKSEIPLIFVPPNPPPWKTVSPANFRNTYEITFSKLIVWIWNNSTSYNLSGAIYYHLNT